MRVSVRLQQSLWASALVMSLAVIQSPTMAFGQNEFSAGYQPASTPSGALAPRSEQQGDGPVDKNTMAEARRFLLKARQALAHSDVATAEAMVRSANQFAVNFDKAGDSPNAVESMIARQIHLATLAQNGDSSYNAGAASFLLTQAESLIQYQDFATAKMLVSQARKFPVVFTADIGNPDQLEQTIELARNNAAVAQAAPAMARPFESSKKPAAMKFLSQAQLAMDQEKWNEAKYFVDQAKALDVPENQFAANEARPWQMELKIQNALNRQGFDPAVVPTSFESQSDSRAVQASYNPGTDTTHNVAATAMDTRAPELAFNTNSINANQSYLQGMAALNDRNPVAAKASFINAWENKDQLDPATLQALQDQLTRLTMSDNSVAQVTRNSGFAVQTSGFMEIDDAQMDAKTLYRELQSEVFRQRKAADQLMKSNPRAAMEIITAARGRVTSSQLDANTQRPLLNMIDNDITDMQQYINQNLSEIENEETNTVRRQEIELRGQRRVDADKQIQTLVQKFNELVDEKRFAESLVVARQANDLAPDSEIAVLLNEKAKLIRNIWSLEDIRAQKERAFLRNINDVERSAISNDPSTPVQIGDPELWRSNTERRRNASEQSRYRTDADRRIWNTLKTERVQGEYRSTLADAMDQLARQAGVNIVFDELALAAENVQKDRAIDIPIREPISLQSALEVILQSAGLVFVVEHEVIKVTSREARQSKLTTETYYIGDLVMPMEPPKNPMAVSFSHPQVNNGYMGGNMNVANTGSGSQLAMAQQLGNRPGLGNPNPFGGGINTLYRGDRGPQTGLPVYGTVGPQPMGGITLLDFIPLIDLIQNTIASDSWESTGTGLGTIEAFPSNLSLIVSQTQEVQDQIQDLLKKLRELNDVQIVVEVRFITLRDSFFERVGIDFDFSINENSAVINPNGDVQTNGSTIVGQAPVDSTPFTPTSDLDLQFLQGSFSAAEPVFGGFSAASAATFGFAILSDIEVFFLIQASKGDTRTNITQAPTVTMFNGQSASISDGSTRPFVTSVIPVVGDFAVAHQPVITLLPDGTNLNVTAVVSADRRFVRLQLVPFFSQVTSVENFTFDGSTSTKTVSGSILDDLLDIVDGDNDDDDVIQETTTQGITIQLPVLAGTTLNTVVSVPDGGTVLMGGVKRMSEGRQEAGVPFLSNLPYVNRLFKNVGIGQETSNLMMMVTPRIIIQKEIEEDQTGVIADY